MGSRPILPVEGTVAINTMFDGDLTDTANSRVNRPFHLHQAKRIFTDRKGGVMFSEVCVILSIGGRADPPLEATPHPGTDT